MEHRKFITVSIVKGVQYRKISSAHVLIREVGMPMLTYARVQGRVLARVVLRAFYMSYT